MTHWSSRLLAAELGLGFATVARIWRSWDLHPWRVETFKFSTDPVSAVTELPSTVICPALFGPRDLVSLHSFLHDCPLG